MIDIQRKVYNLGIIVSLSTKFAQSELIVVDSLTSPETKKEMIQKLTALGISGKKVSYSYSG
jgi:ribosomal protein L4